jgi:hypothetical protein
MHCVLVCLSALYLYGQRHEMIFFGGLLIFISTFCLCADGFQCLSKAFHYPIQLLTFICFFEITHPIQNLFSGIGRCPLVPTSHWLQGKCAKTNLSQAASGLILLSHRRLPVSIFSFFEAGYWREIQNW